MTTRKLQGPLGGDYQTDGAGNAVLLNAYPLTQEDDVPLRLADHEARVTAAEAGITTQIYPTFAPSAPIPRQPQETIVTTFSSGHGWTNNGAGTFNLNDTSQAGVLSRTQHVSITTDATTNPSRVRLLSGLNLDLTNRYLRIYLKVDDPAKVTSIYCYGGSDNLTSFWLTRLMIPPFVSNLNNYGRFLPGEWACVTFALDDTDGAVTGSPNIAAITALQITVNGKAGETTAVRLGGISTVPKPSTLYPNGVVSFTWDDTYLTQYTLGLPVFAARGVRPTLYTVAEAADTGGGAMTVAQLRELQDRYGWEVAGHATSWARHNNSNGFVALTLSELHDEFRTLKSWMAAKGFLARDHLALPRGCTSTQIVSVGSQYFTSIRGDLQDANAHESLPPSVCDGRYKLVIQPLDNTLTLAQMKASIDRAKLGKSWLIWVGHKIDNTTAAVSQAKTSDVADLIDYCIANSVPVRPVGDVLASLSGSYS